MVALAGLILAWGYPAAERALYRSRLRGTLDLMVGDIQAAREIARRSDRPCYVQADFKANRVATWCESGRRPGFSPDDDTLEASVFLPIDLHFAAPADDSPEGPHAVEGLAPERYAVLQPDGGVGWSGAIRLGDVRGNYLEIVIGPGPKTALRKWAGEHRGWRLENAPDRWTWY